MVSLQIAQQSSTVPTRGVHNLGDPFISSTLTEEQSGCGGMSQNMSTDWLTAVCSCEQSTGSRIRLNLVGLKLSVKTTERDHIYNQKNSQIKLFGHACRFLQKLIQFLLPISELTTPTKIGTEAAHDTVDYQQSELISGELLSEIVQ